MKLVDYFGSKTEVLVDSFGRTGGTAYYVLIIKKDLWKSFEKETELKNKVFLFQINDFGSEFFVKYMNLTKWYTRAVEVRCYAVNNLEIIKFIG